MVSGFIRKKIKSMSQNITIGIPTYNREKQLRFQLECIFNQDLTYVQEIIIVDNNSDYDIEELINEFDNQKIRLIKHSYNIKMSTNMEMPFLYCKTKWLWLLSDDDEVLSNSINSIVDEIKECSSNTAMIKFSIDRQISIQKNCEVSTLEEFIDYYYKEKPIRRGDLVFISTNLFNLDLLKNYLGSVFEFSYTYIGYLIPPLLGLNKKEISVKFSSKTIVKYVPPRDEGWSFWLIGKGLSTLSHIPLNISKQYKKKFLNITMLIPYKSFIGLSLSQQRIDNINNFKIIYNNIYKYYISWKAKLFVNIFFILMASSPTRKLLYIFYKLFKKIK